ncbi:rhomboid family [Haematococcus lacustris]|uniref:Rhomboid family n=1 Tax=Haematococcus lacustris TaxID=44745 RepID=A0A699YGF7_HAELA|nr:rhomboid family [Haematococcus lacustris]
MMGLWAVPGPLPAKVLSHQGAEEAQGFASGLLLFPPGQSGGEGAVGQVAHALSACCLAPGPLELALTVWALALVAPRAESLLGYASFSAIYLLSGAAALLAQSQLAAASVATGVPAAAVAAGAQAAGGGGGEGPLGFSGATGAVVGVVVALLLHTWRNR